MSDEELLKLALEREKKARKEAERILEQKSLELYELNKQLAQANSTLESKIESRTAELQVYSSRLETLIANLNSAILVEDQHRNIILTNQSFCNLFQIPAPPKDLVGMDCSGSAEQSKHLFAEPEVFVNRISEILANRQPVLRESLKMADGSLLERDYIPIVFDNNYYGHLWKYSNVTEQVHIKDELESLARFPEENPSPIMRCTPEGELLYCNQVGHELLEQIREPQYNQALHELNQAIHDAYQKKEKMVVEVSVAARWYNVNIIPIANKQYVNLYFNDITERKRFQTDLDAQKQFYESILNKIPTDIAVFDTKHRYLFVNPVAVKNKEVREWLIGKDDFQYCEYRNRDITLAKERRARFIKAVSYKEGIEWEDKMVDESGEAKYLYRRMFPVFDEKDELQMVIGFGIDITKVKQAEMFAEESAKAKEIFLANMSHEIRTPLNAISGLINMLGKSTLDEKQKSYLELIKKSSDNLLVIINDILDLSKITSGKIDFEQIPFNVNEICGSAVDALSYKAEEKGLKLIYHPLSFTSKSISGDPFRLTQILLNLLNNAIKFTENGQVELLVRATEETNDTITILYQVKDTGIGIEDESLPTLFDEFTQGNEDIHKKYGGTGLGLNISKKLVELQGGRIWVESQPGKGSTFSFEMTYIKSDPDKKTIQADRTIEKTGLKGTRVLLAEDNEVNQFIARSIMEEWGCEVTIANNGNQAVQKWQEGQFDVILMDIQMPELNGMDSTKQIRERETESGAHIPIIALTANALKGDKEKYLQAGMDDYVSKPFEEDELYLKISAVLNKKVEHKPVAVEPTIAVASDAALFKLDKLNQIGHNNSAFIAKMLKLFIETTPDMLNQMESAAKANDWEKVSGIAHKLKPTIQTLQIEQILFDIEQLEKQALTNPNKAILLPVLTKVVFILRATVEQVLQKLANMKNTQ